jgi:hypothetical protein
MRSYKTFAHKGRRPTVFRTYVSGQDFMRARFLRINNPLHLPSDFLDMEK